MIENDEYRKRLEADLNSEARSAARMLGLVLILAAACAGISTCIGIAYWAAR